ncbi:8925_t:CDS:2, partial [Ambispora gerdemannii]
RLKPGEHVIWHGVIVAEFTSEEFSAINTSGSTLKGFDYGLLELIVTISL